MPYNDRWVASGSILFDSTAIELFILSFGREGVHEADLARHFTPACLNITNPNSPKTPKTRKTRKILKIRKSCIRWIRSTRSVRSVLKKKALEGVMTTSWPVTLISKRLPRHLRPTPKTCNQHPRTQNAEPRTQERQKNGKGKQLKASKSVAFNRPSERVLVPTRHQPNRNQTKDSKQRKKKTK